VPVPIAAERGLPALAIWIWFVAVAFLDLLRVFRTGRHRMLAAAGLAAMTSMLVAGMFEHNFGRVPDAAAHSRDAAVRRRPSSASRMNKRAWA